MECPWTTKHISDGTQLAACRYCLTPERLSSGNEVSPKSGTSDDPDAIGDLAGQEVVAFRTFGEANKERGAGPAPPTISFLSIFFNG